MRALRVRRRGAGSDGDGVDGPVESAAITACLRFIPVLSGGTDGSIDAKTGSAGDGKMATAASPVLGRTAADSGAAAGDMTDSFGFALETANKRDLEPRSWEEGVCSGRYADGGDGGVDAGRGREDPEVSVDGVSGVRGVIGAEETFESDINKT